jgi:hypothetical protein
MQLIEKYFNAEKYESILFIIVGLTAIGFAIYYLTKVKLPFNNGMAYPLILVALIQLVVGTSVLIRSPKDIARVNTIVQTDKAKIQSEEIPRMEVVMKNFDIYRWVEIALLVLGIILFFAMKPETFWKGIGLGLAIQSSFMLALDYFAESRGKWYLAYLRELVQ